MRSRMIHGTLCAVCFMLLAAVGAAAQSPPTADGVVTPGEYTIEKVDGAIHLYASFDSEKIHLAVTGRTTGWVAIGVDSLRMNGAKIFMGYFADGKQYFTSQIGVYHRHHETTDFSALAHAVGESNGTTTLEIVLDRRSYLEPGQTTLDIIYAMGRTDSFQQYHAQRGATTLNVE